MTMTEQEKKDLVYQLTVKYLNSTLDVLEAEIQTVYLGDFKYVKTKGVVLRC